MSPRGSHTKRPHAVEDRRVRPTALKARIAELDQRQASDTRDEVARWLGDPPPLRSALAQRGTKK